MRTARQMLKDAVINYKKKNTLNVTQLSKDIGLSFSTCYHPLRENAGCNADNWLVLLDALGAIKTMGNGDILIKNTAVKKGRIK